MWIHNREKAPLFKLNSKFKAPRSSSVLDIHIFPSSHIWGSMSCIEDQNLERNDMKARMIDSKICCSIVISLVLGSCSNQYDAEKAGEHFCNCMKDNNATK